jgi:NAD(P)-dependent dehydrogenase (short-subunit alcohol dehydrogenase family)
MIGVADDVVVVTGGAQGIGAAIAQRFVEDGARVFSFDLDTPSEPRDNVVDVRVDVADETSVARGFEIVREDHETIDALATTQACSGSTRRPACRWRRGSWWSAPIPRAASCAAEPRFRCCDAVAPRS